MNFFIGVMVWKMLTQEEIDRMSDQEVVVWYNDNVLYPDKVWLNCYYYRNYSFVKDIQMILCTVLEEDGICGGGDLTKTLTLTLTITKTLTIT